MSSRAAAAPDAYALLPRIATVGGMLVAVILLTHWPTYSYLVLGGPLPLLYYLLPGFLATAIVFLRPSAAMRVLGEPVFWWFALYMISGLAWLLLSQDFPDVANRQWRLRFLGFYFFCTALLIASIANRSMLALAIFACIFIAGALNWFDVLFPLRMVPRGIDGANPGRGAGMFINANGAAAFVLMGTIAALPYTRMRYRAAVLWFAAIAILPTFSRFGFIFFVLLIGLVMAVKLLDRIQLAFVVAAIPVFIAGAGLYQHFLLDPANPNQNIAGRLEWFRTLGQEVDFSARERAYVAQRARDAFMESPLYGHGVGATVAKGQRVGTHNSYLLLMVEQGLLGLALYLSLIALVAHRGWKLARTAVSRHVRDIGMGAVLYAMFLALYGFVSHNVLEEPHGMFILAFIIAASMTRNALYATHAASHNRQDAN